VNDLLPAKAFAQRPVGDRPLSDLSGSSATAVTSAASRSKATSTAAFTRVLAE